MQEVAVARIRTARNLTVTPRKSAPQWVARSGARSREILRNSAAVRLRSRGGAVNARLTLIAAAAIAASACDFVTDPATRLAYDIEAGADLLASGTARDFQHPPRHAVEIRRMHRALQGPARQSGRPHPLVQSVVVNSSHSTSYHARFVEMPQTVSGRQGSGRKHSPSRWSGAADGPSSWASVNWRPEEGKP